MRALIVIALAGLFGGVAWLVAPAPAECIVCHSAPCSTGPTCGPHCDCLKAPGEALGRCVRIN